MRGKSLFKMERRDVSSAVYIAPQGEVGGPGQKGSKGDKGELVSLFFLNLSLSLLFFFGLEFWMVIPTN